VDDALDEAWRSYRAIAPGRPLATECPESEYGLMGDGAIDRDFDASPVARSGAVVNTAAADEDERRRGPTRL
jgi:hypothetical protein